MNADAETVIRETAACLWSLVLIDQIPTCRPADRDAMITTIITWSPLNKND